MAFVEKYFAEFIANPDKTSERTRRKYRLQFLLDGYTGASTELQVYKDSAVKSSKTTSESDRIVIWHPRKLDIKLRAKSEYDVRDFYVDTDRTMMVRLQCDPTGTGNSYTETPFIGWVLSTDLTEQYKKLPYQVEVSAVCGLSTLKDRPLVDANDKRLQGYVSVSTVLRMAFAQTGLNLPMVAGVNLYEHSLLESSELSGGKVDLSRCPLYETTIHSDKLITDNGTTLTCEEAIKMCFTYQVRVGQARGRWYVVRADEAGGDWDAGATATDQTTHFRTYASTNLYDPPTQGLDESVDLSVLIYPDLPVRVLNNDPKTRLLRVLPGVRIDQQFGRFRNRGNADWSLADETGLPTGWLRQNISAQNAFRAGAGTEADPYYVQLNGYGDEKINSDTPCIRTSISYDTTVESFTKPKRYRITGKFKAQTIRKAKLFIKFYADKGEGFLADQMVEAGGTLIQNPTKKQLVGILFDHAIIVNNQMRTKTGFGQIDILTDPVASVVRMDIWVCIGEALDVLNPSNGKSLGPNPGPPQPWVRYYPLTISIEEEGVNIDSTQVTITKTKQVIDSLATFAIGDVPSPASPTERVGTLFSKETGKPTTRHYHPTDLSRANGMPLLNWAALSHARQKMQSNYNFDGTIIGDLPYDLHTILRFKDIVEQTSNYTPAWTAGPLRSLSFQFLLSNRITPSNYLPLLRVGDKILISGTTLNDGVYTVASLGLNTNRNWFFAVTEPIQGETVTNAATISVVNDTPTGETKTIPFQITRLETDYRACRHEVTAQQIVKKPVKSLPQPQQFWVDKDGNETALEVDDEENTVTPTASINDASLAAGVIRQLGAAGLLNKNQAVFAGLDGHTPITNSKNTLEIFNGTTLLATVKAGFRKQIDLSSL